MYEGVGSRAEPPSSLAVSPPKRGVPGAERGTTGPAHADWAAVGCRCAAGTPPDRCHRCRPTARPHSPDLRHRGAANSLWLPIQLSHNGRPWADPSGLSPLSPAVQLPRVWSSRQPLAAQRQRVPEHLVQSTEVVRLCRSELADCMSVELRLRASRSRVRAHARSCCTARAASAAAPALGTRRQAAPGAGSTRVWRLEKRSQASWPKAKKLT